MTQIWIWFKLIKFHLQNKRDTLGIQTWVIMQKLGSINLLIMKGISSKPSGKKIVVSFLRVKGLKIDPSRQLLKQKNNKSTSKVFRLWPDKSNYLQVLTFWCMMSGATDPILTRPLCWMKMVSQVRFPWRIGGSQVAWR